MRSTALLPALLAVSLFGQSWVQLQDFPGSPRDDAAQFTINGNIYIGTGRDDAFALTNDWWKYDTGSGTWSPIASLPASPRQYCAAFTVNGTGYLFGGKDDNGALAELWAYSPAEDHWDQRASLPAEGRYTSVAAEGWNYGIVATGILESGSPTNEAWRYWPSTDGWEAMTPVPGPARHHAMGTVGFAGASVIGGADAGSVALSDAWSYPIWFETGEWMAAPALPEPRYWGRAVGQDRVMVLGGLSGTNEVQDEVWVQSGSEWASAAAFSGGPRKGGILAAVPLSPNVQAYYTGLGIDGTNTRHRDWWKMDLLVSVSGIPATTLGIFPNPAQDRVELALPHHGPDVQVHVHDACGRLVRQAIDPVTLELSGLAAGRYEVVATGSSWVLHGSFIKLP